MTRLEEYAKAQVQADLSDADIIQAAEERGYLIHKPHPPAPTAQLDIDRLKGDRIRLGVASDLHFGSKAQQPTLLAEHYRYFKRRRVDAILIPGDITDGATTMHPGFEYELFAHGFDAQKQVAQERIPDIGRPQYVIGGNHDASHYKAAGADIVRAICEDRDDLHYLSGGKAHRGSVGYVQIAGVLIQLAHPHLPATRQRSYRVERWIENLQPPRPQVCFLGNFHRNVELYDEGRDCWGIMVPSFQALTNFLASKGASSVVGSCIVEIGIRRRRLAPSLTVEWLIEYEPRENDW